MKLYLYILLISFFAIRCSFKKVTNEAPLINVVQKDEKFRINLVENHTNGYLWQMNNNFDLDILEYYGSVFHGNQKGVDFNFKTLKKGKTTLNFALIKYRDTVEVKQFIIDVQ